MIGVKVTAMLSDGSHMSVCNGQFLSTLDHMTRVGGKSRMVVRINKAGVVIPKKFGNYYIMKDMDIYITNPIILSQ